MHNYIEIQKVREHDVIVDKDLVLKANVNAFLEGDIVSVTEKLDGAQSHIQYDSETNSLKCFSSKSEVSPDHDLRGFYDYVQTLDVTPFEKYPKYEFFGEWLIHHTVRYSDEHYNKWYLFSIYDTENNKWLPQSFVKGFAMKYHLNYPHELYYGPFRGWDHIYSLCNNPSYGSVQEGVVIKNQTALEASRGPHILKYVNADFVEIKIQNHLRKKDQNHMSEKLALQEYVDMIVTDARVIKCLHKLVDDNIIKSNFVMSDMETIVKYLPDRVYDDCVKEVKDIVDKIRPHDKTLISRSTILVVRKVLICSD